MADPNVEDADLAVDELKRRARRRLVGAIVLALAAAVILPLLLEKEPRPLGDDVSVQIPPIDEGRFVNRLTGKGADTKPLPKQEAKAAAKPAAPAEAAPQPAVPAASPDAPAAAATAAPASTPPSTASAPKKSVAEAEQRVLAPASKPAAKADGKPAPEAKPAPPPAPVEPPAAPAVAKGEGFVVQIAAFADDKGANAQAAKLVRAGYAGAYVEPVQTSRGTLWRVRVGGYATRADAEGARAKLKADGYNGLVVPTK